MIRRTGLAPWKSEFPFPGSLTSTFPRKQESSSSEGEESDSDGHATSSSESTSGTLPRAGQSLHPRKRVALKRTVAELRTLYYTNLYQIYHRNCPVSRTFEIRIDHATSSSESTSGTLPRAGQSYTLHNRETGIFLPKTQRQHRTSHAPKDVLPPRICANYCALHHTS